MKRLAYILAILCVGTALALTPNERKMVQKIKAEVEEGQADYDAARAGWARADKKAADAEGHAAETEGKLAKAQGDFDRVNKDNKRMQPVYDECTSKWGLGAIWFGIKDLTKHLLIMLAVLVVLAIGLWIASIAAPEAKPIIMIVFYSVGGVFKGIGRGIGLVFTALHNLLERLVAKLKPKPAPPAPFIPPPLEGPTGATGPGPGAIGIAALGGKDNGNDKKDS